MMDLRVVPKFLKSLGHATTTPRGQLHYYRERQLSFDKTPIFHVKMHRPASMRFNIPCITPQVDFDYDFDDADCEDYDGARRSFLGYHEEECDDQEKVPAEEEEIDLRAEEFIAKFYEQMKLQRQISYLQYTDKLNAGT